MMITFRLELFVDSAPAALPALPHGLLHRRMDEAGDIAAQASDFPYQ